MNASRFYRFEYELFLVILLGDKLSIQPSLATKTTTAKAKEADTLTTKEENITTITAVEESTTKTVTTEEIKTTKDVKETTIIEEEEPTVEEKTPTAGSTAAKAGTEEKATSVTSKLNEQESLTTTKPVEQKTRLTTIKSLKTETVREIRREETQSTEAPAATKTAALTTLAPADEIKVSPTAAYKASSDIGYTVMLEPEPYEEDTPIMTSHPVVSSFNELMTSSPPTEIVASLPQDVEQTFTVESSQMSTGKPILTSHPPPISQKQMIASQIMTSHPVVRSSPVVEILTSSKSPEQMVEAESEIVSSKSTRPAVGLSHPVVTSSQIMKLMAPTKEMVAVDLTSNRVVTSSLFIEEAPSSEALKNEPSTIFRNQKTFSRALATETLKKTLPSSKQFSSSQSVEITSLPQIVRKTTSQAKGSITLLSSEAVKSTKIERLSLKKDLTSHAILMTSQTILMSADFLKSHPAAEYSSKKTQIIMPSQSTRSSISSSLTPSRQIKQAVSSSKNMKFMASYQTMKPSPVFTGFLSLKNTMSSLEVKATKSTLILSSSQLADMTTSSPTAVTSVVVEPPTEENKATSTQLPGSVMTPLHSSSPVVIATSNASVGVKVVLVTSESATEHPTHHEDKHHTHAGETHAHTNHTDHGENVTHHTMGYPHEADVDASTDEKQRVDANWEVSVFVVIALMGGMIVFVVFMVIKDRARTRFVVAFNRSFIEGRHRWSNHQKINTFHLTKFLKFLRHHVRETEEERHRNRKRQIDS